MTELMPPWDVAAVRAAAATAPTAEQSAVLEREVGVYRRVVEGGGRLALGTDAPLTPVGLHLHSPCAPCTGTGCRPRRP